MTSPKTNPIAVVISDIHYSMPTLEVADNCLRQAVAKANELEVRLIIAGDLHDTKANLRGECVKAILDTLALANHGITILVGNHDKINEKSDGDALEFIRMSDVELIRHPVNDLFLNVTFIPYQHDPEEMRRILAQIPTGSRLIIHQGRHGALPGSYSHDRSALSDADYAPFKVISGHYHNHQVMGNFTYIGNPYTLNFAECADHPKGYIIINDDFSIEHVRTNVRNHVILNFDARDLTMLVRHQGPTDDITLVRVKGSRADLAKVTRDEVELNLRRSNFRLDLIPTDSEVVKTEAIQDRSATELFTTIIDKSDQLSEDDKEAIKKLWLEYST